MHISATLVQTHDAHRSRPHPQSQQPTHGKANSARRAGSDCPAMGYNEDGVWLGNCPSSLVWPDTCCVSLNVIPILLNAVALFMIWKRVNSGEIVHCPSKIPFTLRSFKESPLGFQSAFYQ